MYWRWTGRREVARRVLYRLITRLSEALGLRIDRNAAEGVCWTRWGRPWCAGGVEMMATGGKSININGSEAQQDGGTISTVTLRSHHKTPRYRRGMGLVMIERRSTIRNQVLSTRVHKG